MAFTPSRCPEVTIPIDTTRVLLPGEGGLVQSSSCFPTIAERVRAERLTDFFDTSGAKEKAARRRAKPDTIITCTGTTMTPIIH